MNKEKYEDLMLRFAKEMHEVGVTDSMKEVVEAQYTRTPNLVGCKAEEAVRKFTYRHNGYEIEAVQRVTLVLKKCN
mgnify:CR=1 FL=1